MSLLLNWWGGGLKFRNFFGNKGAGKGRKVNQYVGYNGSSRKKKVGKPTPNDWKTTILLLHDDDENSNHGGKYSSFNWGTLFQLLSDFPDY